MRPESARPETQARRQRIGRAAGLVGALMLAVVPTAPAVLTAPALGTEIAETLAETGLYADPARQIVDPRHLAFQPNFPLWTDGATKRRWLSLPEGAVIDASDPDAWEFPVGTRLWKEFAFDGHKVETRYIERRADGSWLFATYAWNEAGTDALLVSEQGRKRGHDLGDGRFHAIPGQKDCRACHLSAPVPVLGIDALQLPNGPADAATLTLAALQDRGQITPGAELAAAPDIARSDTERAALGYLHGNCGHCHNDRGPLAGLHLYLRQSAVDGPAASLATTLGHPLKSPPPPGLTPGTVLRVAPGDPQHSALPQRIASRTPGLQMPPIGTARADEAAIELITRWITEVGMVPPAAQPRESPDR